MTIPPSYTLYCDESGNTGGNFLDPDQPVYTLAGWLVPTAEIQVAENLVLQFEQKLTSQGDEIKSKHVLKSQLGLIATHKLFNSLGKVGCLPTFSMAEKKYCVAAKIVDTFLDPAHNDNVHPDLLWDTLEKQAIAELFVELPQIKLTSFATAFRNADSIGLTQSAKDISLYLKLSLHQSLADMIEGALPQMDTIAKLEQHSNSYLPNKAMQALNTPTAVQFFMMANQFGKRVGGDIRIVHDESFYYQEAIESVFTLHKEAQEDSISFPHATLSTGNKNLLSIEFVRSEMTPLMRAADILAGALTQHASNVTRQLSPNHLLSELVSTILPVSLDSVQLGWFTASSKHVQECFKLIRE
ncbi:DUF3800 domain-containing protein [Nitrospira sp. NS4]|uniref:DUF3800 domain-containing protein n=1 Tax=Nitrospira sp. NS4 TaxID=3414498 RepID=UPI003C2E8CAA